MKKTVIVSGGIAGLATAYYLHESGAVDYTLIECSPRFGGKITTEELDGFVVEGGPDSFITQKAVTIELCKSLGSETNSSVQPGQSHHVCVWSGGRTRPMREGMMLMAPTMVLPFLRSKLISWPGKLRIGDRC